MVQGILCRFKGYPKALVFVFHITNFIISILLWKIIGVKDFVKRRKILSTVVYYPIKLLNREIVLYNNRYNYYFFLYDTSSYSVMMLSHEDDVPLLIYSLLRRIKDPVFIDVGAHLGAYVLTFSKICKLVVAVEPNPVNYLILRMNLAINKIKNCIPVKYMRPDTFTITLRMRYSWSWNMMKLLELNGLMNGLPKSQYHKILSI